MVTAEEGETVAGDLACAFFETSSYASEGWKGIADAFDELCREVSFPHATDYTDNDTGPYLARL